ncbi:hypothetical protein [Fulvivirga lutea]|uniref:Uncharacterized protein n=1 Tax=Fulvivirga lutea TaxID=2810512 RepID=A0A974WGY8_9BACT|nr:hypothetical protein [Fulvivirga lutea]QSE96932.1 hypothetical protein JR347_15225 [Fulvivirga lutea]
MSRIKVKIDPDIPSLDVIHSYRDFNSLMDNYRKYYSTSGIRYMFVYEKKKLVYIVIIIIFLLLLLFGNDSEAANHITL